jgi:hypothetical protein
MGEYKKVTLGELGGVVMDALRDDRVSETPLDFDPKNYRKNALSEETLKKYTPWVVSTGNQEIIEIIKSVLMDLFETQESVENPQRRGYLLKMLNMKAVGDNPFPVVDFMVPYKGSDDEVGLATIDGIEFEKVCLKGLLSEKPFGKKASSGNGILAIYGHDNSGQVTVEKPKEIVILLPKMSTPAQK